MHHYTQCILPIPSGALPLFRPFCSPLSLFVCLSVCFSLSLFDSLSICLYVLSCLLCPLFWWRVSRAPYYSSYFASIQSTIYLLSSTTLSSCMVLLLLLPYPFFSFHAASLWCGCNRLESAQNLRRSDWRRPASDHLTDLHFTWRKTCMRRLATARRTTFRMSVYHRRSFLSCVLFLST